MKFAVGVLACAAALGGASAHVVLEKEASSGFRGVPAGWAATKRSDGEQGLELVFAVKQTNVDVLERTLLEVSDPDHERYGQHLSNEAVHAMVAPEPSSIAAVLDYLEAHGIKGKPLTPNSDFIRADVTVAQAEALLSTEYHMFEHANSNLTVHRTMSYSLPDAVAAAVDFVAPTVHIPAPARKPIHPSEPSKTQAAGGNTPGHLRDLYSVNAEGKAADNKMAVTAFLEQYYSVNDLKSFWTDYCSGITCGQGEPTVVGDGGTGSSGIESMLDIETITGVAGNVHAEFWGFSGRSPDNKDNEPFLKWLTQVSSTPDASVPQIFSTSYGEDEDSWSYDAASRLNTEFQKAGTRGITLLYASGDEGANCKGSVYKPEAPGSSPWVTAVGGTQGATTETAIGLSSGGFSDYWPQPAYQKDAVANYLSTASNLPDKSKGYNITGRAYPDISAQASDFTVVANGFPLPGVSGTSCATPTAAGVIAMLNDARLQAGKPVLGFLNPWIYKNAKLWNDITSGASSGCGFSAGWPASAGWDAVTGVGTPNYQQLLSTLP